MNLKLRLLITVMLTTRMLSAQNSEQITTYINNYKDLAISEQQRSGVPASITLAQGIHETLAGTSDLVIASNNHFGIKCKDDWNGKVTYHDDDARGECFRSYSCAADSYKDHSDFLRNGARYAFLFSLNPEDYESWAYGLKKAGYATNIRYSQILIKLIQDYELQQYCLIALGKLPVQHNIVTTIDTKEKTTGSVTSITDAVTQKPTAAIIYPEGTFSINQTKVIYAKSGISLLLLSSQYDVPLARLFDFNDMQQQEILNNDQLIFLQRKRKTGLTAYHIVQPEETVYMICQSEGIRYENILEFNRLKPGEEPAPGEKLYLQTNTGNKPALRNSGNARNVLPSS
jgi:hypothetical protein